MKSPSPTGDANISSQRDSRDRERELRRRIARPRPVWPTSNRPGAFGPLVWLIGALLPALCVWYFSPQAYEKAVWSLRALQASAAGAGVWADPVGPVAPLYLWCLEAALAIPWTNEFTAASLPPYLFGLAYLAATTWLARLWIGPGVGLLAGLLLCLDAYFLRTLQVGSDDTCVAAVFVAALLAYSWHLHRGEDGLSLWTLPTAAIFALAFLSGGVAVVGLVLVLGMHQLRSIVRDPDRPEGTLAAVLAHAPTVNGTLALGVGLLVALPLGWASLDSAATGGNAGGGSVYWPWQSLTVAGETVWQRLFALVRAVPATAVLAAYGLARAVQETAVGGEKAPASSLLAIWTLVAVMAVLMTPATPALVLLAVAPLTVLAARVLTAVLKRDVPDRTVLVLMALTLGFFLADWLPVLYGWPPPWERSESVGVTAGDLLRLHLGLDVLVVGVAAMAWAFTRTRGRDRSRRVLLGTFFVWVLALAAVPTVALFTGVRTRNDPWFGLRRSLERIDDVGLVVVYDPARAADRPQMILAARGRFPRAAVVGAGDQGALDTVLRERPERPLVIVPGLTDQLPQIKPVVRDGRTVTLAKVYDTPAVIAYALPPPERTATPEKP